MQIGSAEVKCENKITKHETIQKLENKFLSFKECSKFRITNYILLKKEPYHKELFEESKD